MTQFDVFTFGAFTATVFFIVTAQAQSWLNRRRERTKQFETLRKENEELRIAVQKPHFVNVGFSKEQIADLSAALAERIQLALSSGGVYKN